jgi:hypothetical protein
VFFEGVEVFHERLCIFGVNRRGVNDVTKNSHFPHVGHVRQEGARRCCRDGQEGVRDGAFLRIKHFKRSDTTYVNKSARKCDKNFACFGCVAIALCGGEISVDRRLRITESNCKNWACRSATRIGLFLAKMMDEIMVGANGVEVLRAMG